MNNFVKNFLIIFTLCFGLFVFSGGLKVSEAQVSGCQIESANFRPSGVINNYSDQAPPTVYFDIQTSDCNTMGVSNMLRIVFYSVDWQSSTLGQIEIHRTDRFYMAPSSVTTNPFPTTIMSNQSDFSIPILLGEEGSENGCEWNFNAALWGVGGSLVGPDSPDLFINPQINNMLNGGDIPDCMIFAKIYKSNANNPSAGEELIFSYGDINDPKLLYECYGICNMSWSVVGSFCFGPNNTQNTNNGLVPYMGSCPLSSSTISVTTIDGSNSGGILGSNEYSTEPLAPLPGFTGNPDLGQWLESLFTILIVIAGLLALIMIIVGGITYITSESFGDKGKGKGYIMNAIAGLVLALGAWVVLNTINPELAEDLNIKIPTVSLDGYEYSAPGVASIGSSCGPKNGINCPDCQPIEGGIVLKPEVAVAPHNTIKSNMRSKLYTFHNSLTSSNISWRVTEAFTPTYVQHCSQCHYNGTCIDANFTSTAATPQNIQAFVDAAAQVGLRAVYETNSQSTIAEIQQQTNLQPSTKGGQGNYLLLNGITAPHFSVYNQ